MKKVFISNNKVVSVAIIHQYDGVSVQCNSPYDMVKELPTTSLVDLDYIYDPETDTFTAPAPTPPKVDPIHFQLLFKSDELVKVDELKSTDRALALFWKLIDDPRTQVVDLSLTTIQNSIEYTLNALKNAGLDIDVDARKAEIISGVHY